MVAENPAGYIPRLAFYSLFKNIKHLNKKGFGAFKVDFVFHAQTPSKRPVGGVSIDEFREMVKGKSMEEEAKKKKTPPDEIAKIVLFFSSDDSGICTNQNFIADGGWA